MATFTTPTREEVNENNQGIFDNLQKNLGFVPNLYAYYAHSGTALGDYLAFQNRKSSLKAKEREIINLAVSEVNQCFYCLSAHTALGKMNGFTDEQILEIRSGEASFDPKFDALAKFVRNAVENRSHPSDEVKDGLFNAGYTQENLVDILMVIGDKMVSNFIHGSAQMPIDFPVAQPLEAVTA